MVKQSVFATLLLSVHVLIGVQNLANTDVFERSNAENLANTIVFPRSFCSKVSKTMVLDMWNAKNYSILMVFLLLKSYFQSIFAFFGAWSGQGPQRVQHSRLLAFRHKGSPSNTLMGGPLAGFRA